MTDRQLRTTGLLLVSFLAAALIVGTAWRLAASLPNAGAAAEPAGAEVEDREPPRHITIPAAWRAEEVAQALERAGLADGERFLSLVTDSAEVELPGRELGRPRSLEGYLFPGVYDVGPGFSEASLVAEMTGRFERAFVPTMRRRARELGLSVHEVVTLASIVQREMILPSEAPVIAGVFYNRLKAGIPLKSDPTVLYALETGREWDRQYWRRNPGGEELRVDSAYNTYLRKGLPPGPIASPGRDAILAALYPADVDYFFFVAKGNGAHDFARTGRAHVANVERYRGGRGRLKPQGSELQRIVEGLMSSVEGHVGVVVQNLATEESASLNADEFFSAASLYKLPVMWAAFEERERGRLFFDQRISIAPDAAAQDGPDLQARLGAEPKIGRALEEMIVVSSNAAGVTLLRELGRHAVDRMLREQGIEDTSLSSMRIVTTPRDVARMLELIATGRAVSAEASSEMVDILLRQEIRDRLPKYLGRGVALAHKTGNLESASHDAGILYGRRGPIVVVAMTEGVKNPAEATESIARLGRVVFDYFHAYKPAAARLASRGNPACPHGAFRPQAAGVLSGKTIVLDPGHGGRDEGARFVFPDGLVLTEKDVVLDVASRLREMLVRRGASVALTRCRDASQSLIARTAVANALDPDVVVSIHVNGSPDPLQDGTELYYLSPDGKILASDLLGTFARPALWETLSARRELSNGGVHRRRFGVLVYSLAPTALTEALFLTNPAEAAALRARGGASRRAQIARGHLDGILNYFGVADPSSHEVRRRPIGRETTPQQAEVTIVATGDIAIDDSPADGLFSNVRPHLTGDVVLGNLEGALALGGVSKCAPEPDRRRDPHCFAFRAPPRSAQRLREAGFTVLNLANNHSYDFGAQGQAETVLALDRAGLLHTGRPWQLARQQVGPVRVAIVGAAPYRWSHDLIDLAAAQRLVQRADAWADLVLVTMHAGGEGRDQTHVPTGAERYLGEARGSAVAFAHAVVDAGADLVVGHGPHVLRGMEWYRSRLIAYSLGNLAGTGTLSVRGLLGVGGILRVTLRADGSWERGQLVGIRLVGEGAPVLDPTSPARHVVLDVSREDFGSRAVEMEEGGSIGGPPRRTELTPREKAALLVVSGLPAPVDAGGVIVRRWDRQLPRPPRALVFADQEGGPTRSMPDLPPSRPASAHRSASEAFEAGRATGRALRETGTHVDLAPVLDSGDGPLGRRHFRNPAFGVAFARGLAAADTAACAKHFPGLGSASVSTDEARVRAVLRRAELDAFHAAVRSGVPCVMVGHAIYRELGRRPASLEAATYLLLRKTGFRGVAITDALESLHGPDQARFARRAVEAGADLVLLSDGDEAERAIEALIPLARRGLLDEHVARVLRFRRSFGL